MVKFDINKIREDFPILHQEVNGKPLVYLDNAATTQKPQIVIDTIKNYYTEFNSNVHRGVHYLSQKATDAYENAREKVRGFINAEHSHEIIFTKGTTESINLVASSYGRAFVGKGDEVVISTMEHHSNIVPWQIICNEKGAALKIIPINDDGEIIFKEFEKLLNKKTKLVAITHVSNTLGTINPVKKIIQTAHRLNIPVLLDGAQAMSHSKVDVCELDCDFYCFSGHKMFGPTGIGVLYGKEELLDKMPPYQGGGEMIKTVTFEETSYNDLPYKFEAGTPDISGAIGLTPAIDYLNSIGFDNIAGYEKVLMEYALSELLKINKLHIFGLTKDRIAVFSFLIGDIHHYDTGIILDQQGIAVRTGHNCTQPIMDRFGIPGTVRASFAFYNTKEEVDALVKGILKVKEMFD
ncbi:MAG: cysteine desulfurase [Bacteroidota bacterium]